MIQNEPKRLAVFNTVTDTYYLVKLDTEICVDVTGGIHRDENLTDLIHLLLDRSNDLKGQLSDVKRNEVAITLKEISVAINGAHTMRSSCYISAEQNEQIINMLECAVDQAWSNLVALLSK